jgi:hypothetical protein
VRQPTTNSDAEIHLRYYAAVFYDVAGERIIKESALYPLYERFQQLPHFAQVEKSWRDACALQHFGLPIGKRELTLEEEFFYHLGADDSSVVLGWDPGVVLSRYQKLITDRAKRGDFEFFKRIASARQRPRGRPKAKGLLYSFLLQSWLHAGLWLMTNDDRVKFIQHVLGFRILTASGLPEERVMKAVQRLALLSWWDFPDTYPEAPVKVTVYRNNEVRSLFTDRWLGLDPEWT